MASHRSSSLKLQFNITINSPVLFFRKRDIIVSIVRVRVGPVLAVFIADGPLMYTLKVFFLFCLFFVFLFFLLYQCLLDLKQIAKYP